VTVEPINVDDLEVAARAKLDPGAYGYFAGGAGDEHTLRENAAAFGRWQLRPRVLVDVGEVSTATTVLDTEVALPLLVAPTAFQRLADPEGELATARAAAAAGTIMCLSTLASVSPEELAAAAPGAPQWFQLYWSQDRGFTRELVATVAEAGYRALVLTVDFPVAGARERDLRSAFTLPDDLPLPNLPVALRRQDFHGALGGIVDPTLTWRDLEWLREACPLPLVVKGVLTAEDALLAVEHGAAGVVVSNHGGRQLDGAPATLDVLPEIAEAVGGRVEVLLDGGIRRGVDVLKALALGARAVCSGRAVLWGLASGGERGARQVLELLRSEVERGLKFLGCGSPAEVTRTHVRPSGSTV
jgi:isopentenyl diphosphate isomerase/L-lactate dehydrogenase-like FMN-dependent dehydrogenase